MVSGKYPLQPIVAVGAVVMHQEQILHQAESFQSNILIFRVE